MLLPVKAYDFSVLFVDDGSEDNSWEIIKQICERDRRFQGIRLSRNYGSHIALCAGFDFADADILCTLACDLQDPPEVIIEFLKKWERRAKIVWGKRRSRKDKNWRIFFSNLFFTLIRRYAMPKGSKFTTGSFFLVDRTVAECFRKFKEHNRITFAIVAWTGFEQDVVEYDRRKRVAGVSGWNFSKMIKVMYDAFIGFSLLPIRVMTLMSAGVSLLTFITLVYLIVSWFSGNPLPGWTSVMVTVSFFFSLQFLLMSIVGEYLYRIYAEAVHRPLYFVSEQVNCQKGHNTQTGDE
jgi:dolichol-phosphate mannosyltransferase